MKPVAFKAVPEPAVMVRPVPLPAAMVMAVPVVRPEAESLTRPVEVVAELSVRLSRLPEVRPALVLVSESRLPVVKALAVIVKGFSVAAVLQFQVWAKLALSMVLVAVAAVRDDRATDELSEVQVPLVVKPPWITWVCRYWPLAQDWVTPAVPLKR